VDGWIDFEAVQKRETVMLSLPKHLHRFVAVIIQRSSRDASATLAGRAFLLDMLY
jgi:hypothetical protein